IELLEAGIAEPAHHERARRCGHDERGNQPYQARGTPHAREPYERSDVGCRGRAGNSLEVAFVRSSARVEAREPQRRGYGTEEAGEPAEAARVVAVLGDPDNAPLIRDDRRSEAEGDHVREAVVLLAEGALRVGESRDSSIQGVEDHGDENRPARRGEV